MAHGVSELEVDDGPIHLSRGTLHYGGAKVYVRVDPEIVRYYRALIPPWIPLNPQKYPPHISVVRNEGVPNLEYWGKHEGKDIFFTYTGIVRFGRVYAWLNAFSQQLEDVRMELGLPVTSIYTRPPEGYIKCFHITIGNFKD